MKESAALVADACARAPPAPHAALRHLPERRGGRPLRRPAPGRHRRRRDDDPGSGRGSRRHPARGRTASRGRELDRRGGQPPRGRPVDELGPPARVHRARGVDPLDRSAGGAARGAAARRPDAERAAERERQAGAERPARGHDVHPLHPGHGAEHDHVRLPVRARRAADPVGRPARPRAAASCAPWRRTACAQIDAHGPPRDEPARDDLLRRGLPRPADVLARPDARDGVLRRRGRASATGATGPACR